MKKIGLSIIGSLALVACGSGEGSGEGASNVALQSEIDSVSYAIGVSQAKNVQNQFAEANGSAFIMGFRDVLDSAEMKLTDEESQAVIQAFFQKKQQEEMAKRQKEMEEMYSGLKEEGEKFLEENKSNEGIQVTESGLQYKVIKAGSGQSPVMGDEIVAHYTGTFPDGTVFDSSVERGEPATFVVGQVIPGWNEGLQLMKEGAKYMFYLPQELGYGSTPNPNSPIKPFQVLVFGVELIKVNK